MRNSRCPAHGRHAPCFLAFPVARNAGMPRKRLNWQYNQERQEFVTPSGRTISLAEIVDFDT